MKYIAYLFSILLLISCDNSSNIYKAGDCITSVDSKSTWFNQFARVEAFSNVDGYSNGKKYILTFPNYNSNSSVFEQNIESFTKTVSNKMCEVDTSVTYSCECIKLVKIDNAGEKVTKECDWKSSLKVDLMNSSISYDGGNPINVDVDNTKVTYKKLTLNSDDRFQSRQTIWFDAITERLIYENGSMPTVKGFEEGFYYKGTYQHFDCKVKAL